ncbi:hypothetical protein [Nonomuraea jabiensis]|uniref:hypothetical protein n=1 Tax=Nonomuraea jabiensis TaxID=882448 RepID=UPI003D7360F5
MSTILPWQVALPGLPKPYMVRNFLTTAGSDMTDSDRIQEITIRYVHGDARLRRDFDHRLALFLRAQPTHHRWDITPLVDALDQLGRRIPRVEVTLRCDPAHAELQVSLDFGLRPIPREGP